MFSYLGEIIYQDTTRNDGSTCHSKRQAEPTIVVHKCTNNRSNCQPKVEGGVTPSFYCGFPLRKLSHEDCKVGGPGGCCSNTLYEPDDVGQDEEGGGVIDPLQETKQDEAGTINDESCREDFLDSPDWKVPAYERTCKTRIKILVSL